MFRKNLFLQSTFVIFLFIVIGCNDPAKRHAGKKVFRYNETAKLTSLDPAFANNQANSWGCNQLYNGLVQIDNNLKIKPCVAKNWEIQDNGKTYLFHLRNDVFFHENTTFDVREQFNSVHNEDNPIRVTRKVTAQDFRFSLLRLVDSSLASPCGWAMNHVLRDSIGNLSGIGVIDDTTLRITLTQPFAPFLSILSMPFCSVVPKEAVDYFGNTFGRHPCGTGPFVFRIWKDGDELVLLKNENYFETNDRGDPLPFLDAVEISFLSNPEDAFIQFLRGNLDFMNGIDGSYINEMLTHTGQIREKYAGRFNMEMIPYLNTEHLSILHDCNPENKKDNPLCDKRIRQALSYGFERKNILKYLRNNIGVPGTEGITPPGLPSFDTSKVVGYNYYPSKVRDLLKEAGYPDGQGLPEIVLNTNVENIELCKFMKSQWEEFGFKIRIEENSHSDQMRMIDEGKFSFFRVSWIADYPDAENFLSLFYSKNFSPHGFNYTHFSNKEYDELYEKAIAEVNDSIRFSYYQYLDEMLMENVPVIIAYYDQAIHLSQKNISGLSTNAMNLLVLKNVRKE